MSTLNVSTINVSNVVFPNGSTFTQVPPTPTLNDLISGTPSSGQRLEYNGSAWVPVTGGAGGRLLSMNVYTNQNGDSNAFQTNGGNTNWGRPSGCNSVLVFVTGGGGGSRSNDNSYRGAGGGGGGTAIEWITGVAANVSVTWGGGGDVSRNGGRGGGGGTSSFGPYCNGYGGAGGYTDNPYEGGHGGGADGGNMNVVGGAGEMSHDHNREGGGGMSFWHKAGSNHWNGGGRYNNCAGRWGSGGGYGYYAQNYHGHGRGGGGVVVVYNYS